MRVRPGVSGADCAAWIVLHSMRSRLNAPASLTGFGRKQARFRAREAGFPRSQADYPRFSHPERGSFSDSCARSFAGGLVRRIGMPRRQARRSTTRKPCSAPEPRGAQAKPRRRFCVATREERTQAPERAPGGHGIDELRDLQARYASGIAAGRVDEARRYQFASVGESELHAALMLVTGGNAKSCAPRSGLQRRL
jgi:hypothetical protein